MSRFSCGSGGFERLMLSVRLVENIYLYELLSEDCMTSDALERARREAWAHKEAIKGVRRNTTGERHLCGLSAEESGFLIEYEARRSLGLSASPDDSDKYLSLHRRFEATRLNDFARRIKLVSQHWRRSRAHGRG
jgi:hypothetical protein